MRKLGNGFLRRLARGFGKAEELVKHLIAILVFLAAPAATFACTKFAPNVDQKASEKQRQLIVQSFDRANAVFHARVTNLNTIEYLNPPADSKRRAVEAKFLVLERFKGNVPTAVRNELWEFLDCDFSLLSGLQDQEVIFETDETGNLKLFWYLHPVEAEQVKQINFYRNLVADFKFREKY